MFGVHTSNASDAKRNVRDALQSVLTRGDLIALFLISIIVRLIVLAASNNQIGTGAVFDRCFDCNLYVSAAYAFAVGNQIPENALFYFGSGYILFLGTVIKVFGFYPLLLVIINIIVSSLSSVLIYKLAKTITESYSIGILAGLITCFSYTSITLSCMTMSESFYFTLIALTLLIFLKGLHTERWLFFILSGLLLGFSVLTRSVSQFIPFLLLVVTACYLKFNSRDKRRSKQDIWRIYKRLLVTICIILSFTFTCMIRNYTVHGVGFLSIAGANGPASIAAITIERQTGKYAKETLDEWDSSISSEGTKFGNQYTNYRKKANEVFDTLGSEAIRTYFSVMWENLNDINYLHRTLLPDYNHFMIPLEKYTKDHSLNYLPLLFTLTGFVILIFRKQYWAAAFLILVYSYYSILIGAFRWQGARYAFPGNIAGYILLAITINYIGSGLRNVVSSLNSGIKKMK